MADSDITTKPAKRLSAVARRSASTGSATPGRTLVGVLANDWQWRLGSLPEQVWRAASGIDLRLVDSR